MGSCPSAAAGSASSVPQMLGGWGVGVGGGHHLQFKHPRLSSQPSLEVCWDGRCLATLQKRTFVGAGGAMAASFRCLRGDQRRSGGGRLCLLKAGAVQGGRE